VDQYSFWNNIELNIEINKEDDSSFCLTWLDTIEQKKITNLQNRKHEIWCIIKDSKDTIGHYTSLSTPQNFTYFTTKDSIITVTFMIGQNIFSDSISTKQMNEIMKTDGIIIKYNPIEVNIKKDIRKRLELHLNKTNE